MLSSTLCIYLHLRGLEIPIISSHTATNRSMSDQHKLIQPMSEIWRHFDKGKNPSVRASQKLKFPSQSYILTLASYHTRSMPILVFLFSSPTKERCKQAVENCKVLYDNFFLSLTYFFPASLTSRKSSCKRVFVSRRHGISFCKKEDLNVGDSRNVIQNFA